MSALTTLERICVKCENTDSGSDYMESRVKYFHRKTSLIKEKSIILYTKAIIGTYLLFGTCNELFVIYCKITLLLHQEQTKEEVNQTPWAKNQHFNSINFFNKSINLFVNKY